MESPKTDIPWPHAATLVLAAGSPRQRRWAVGAAIGIVRKLAEQRPKVVLADIQMRRPSSLAATLGLEEGQGIVDVLFRGASFSTTAQKPEGESFYFLPIGTEPPPREVLYRHPRWQKIAVRLADTDAHLLPCVAADDWLEAGPIPGFEACILLNAVGQEIELPEGARRLAEFLAPPGIREEGEGPVDLPAYAETEPTTQPMPRATRRPVMEEAKTPSRPARGSPSSPPPSARPSPVAAGQPVGAGGGPSAATPPERRPVEPLLSGRAGVRGRGRGRDPMARARRRRNVMPAVAIAAAAVVAVVLWRTIGADKAPADVERVEAAAETTGIAVPPPTPVASASPEEPPETGSRRPEVALPYSVAIASYSSFDDAVARQRRWTQEDVPYYVAPTVVRGVVYYRVFAGMLPDRAQAQALMRRLVDEGIKDTAREWDVRPAGLAFSFGTYPSASDARAVLETLLGQGIPAYLVPAAGSVADDEVSYRVYAGGYQNAEDARPLREQIVRAGLDVELVERVGLEQP